MSIFQHDLLFRLVYGLGMVFGAGAFWLVLLLAFAVLRLPRPGNDTAAGMTSASLTICLFFVMGYGGGRVAVQFTQRWVRAACPRCGKNEVAVAFLSFRSGRHRCRACGYEHISPEDPRAGTPAPTAGRRGSGDDGA
ncbi:MAG: hypothetical protein ACRC33_10895 [Gemmataceae bacterium]